MVKSISSCLIRTAAGTAPTLTARDSSQIFSVGEVWISLLKHTSILKFGPLFSWTALKLHKGLFTSWLMVIHIHQTLSTRRPLGEKWQRRRFTSYVLLVPAASWPDTARAYVPHPRCAVGVQRFIFSSHTTTTAPASCTNKTSCLNAASLRHVQVRLLTLNPPSPMAWFLLGFPLGSVALHSSCYAIASSDKDGENSPAPEPCATSPLLTSCSEQAQPLFQIAMLQESVC